MATLATPHWEDFYDLYFIASEEYIAYWAALLSSESCPDIIVEQNGKLYNLCEK